ncbi:MAG: DUF5069 domain-containing protein [Opitutaceae bacterium]|nr:DUF5069 domain-containing protein [Opitutaceae bacterium]
MADLRLGKEKGPVKIPGLRSDNEKVGRIVFFGRMLDKVRLRSTGLLPADYSTGTADRTSFDARCTRFLSVDYEELRRRVLQGGTDEEILEWCFERGRRPNADEIEIWNEFMRKRGWCDSGSAELEEAKRKAGLGSSPEIQTWFELHAAEES